ncbi:MAG: hypothetical protein GYB67_11980, partial [Chloroflexi bacterium]|nr:hypothetical protein [Chloroflexota bacterium]
MIKARCVLGLAVGLCLLLGGVPGAAAQSPDDLLLPTIRSTEQLDLTGDARPNVTIITMDYATPNDRVLVYDGGGDMAVGDDWQA